MRHVASLPDPVGEVVRGSTLPNGLDLRQVRVPLGVVGIIYEARPNVTVDAAALCLKSGNAVLLRGSSSAYASNTALVTVLRDAVGGAGLPADAVQLVPGESRESVTRADARPRPGRRADPARRRRPDPYRRRGLDRAGDRDRHRQLPRLRGRARPTSTWPWTSWSTPRPSGPASATPPRRCSCTATSPTRFLPRALDALAEAGVTVHGDERVLAAAEAHGSKATVVAATAEDWETEYLSYDIAAGVVDSLDAAVAHIRLWSSGHTEAIVTTSQAAARRFTQLVDAAAVMVNASTRFTDGGQFGFGAEIGISTQKLHARGPMGLPELTSTKYVVTGDGHIR